MQRASIVITAVATLAVSAALAVSSFAATRTVAVKDDVFAPKRITVKRGTTLRWAWHGRAPHNVVVTSGPAKFRSRTQTNGAYSKKLTRKGTYKIVCTIHAPMMAMKITVR